MAEVKSAIAGKIAEINIRVGDTVTDDDEILLLEVMKMETPIFGENGTVKEILVAKGESVGEGQTNVFDGLARVGGRWAVVIAFNNAAMAGAWLSGQADNILRVTDISKRLRLPLVYLLNCSGVKLMEQEDIFPNRRGSGTPFFRHAELQELGIPIIVGIWGTNPAGGGYHGISPSVLIAHKDANMSVGGAGIVSGMAPKGFVDDEVAQGLIGNTRALRAMPPGRAEIHHGGTGFFRDVGDTAEKAEMLGLGMSAFYSIEQSDMPMMTVVLRKGSAAAHYVLGGPTANNNNVFTLGTAATEIYVMHGETAAAATYARRLVKEQDAGKPIGETIAKMNGIIDSYHKTSRPIFNAIHGQLDEVVDLSKIRDYCKAFVGCYYQNPKSFCAPHHQIIPRTIRG
ncbi:MAG: hypothetical protein LBS91_08930 [Clostridiales Family XIII bacterium]|jgi:acetyl-CoA carboxylase carboxyltransferase component|nr:hypothetical protein [Clostridiales Family XIII bacterium]